MIAVVAIMTGSVAATTSIKVLLRVSTLPHALRPSGLCAIIWIDRCLMSGRRLSRCYILSAGPDLNAHRTLRSGRIRSNRPALRSKS